MSRDALLIVLTAAGSALCWWPAAIEPSVDFPRWILLVLGALITGLATVLSNGRWLRLVVSSSVGVFAGLWTGFVLFPPSDGIARSYAPLLIAAATVAALHSEPGLYNVVDDDPSEMRACLPAFAAFLGAPPPPHVGETEAQSLGSDALYYATRLRGARNELARHKLAFAPRRLEWLSKAKRTA